MRQEHSKQGGSVSAPVSTAATIRRTADQVESALAETLFSDECAGRPVYAVPDDNAFEAIGTKLRLPGRRAREAVVKTAGLQIDPAGLHGHPFQRLVRKVGARPSRLDAPPCLATLACLSLAADEMHAEAGFGANNFYGRFHVLVGTPQDRRRPVENGYRSAAEQLWDALNDWLTAWEGERGLPTAYVVGSMPYVGLPLSQTLVRRADRDKLPELFADEALPPGLSLAPRDMEAVIDQCVKRQPPLFSTTLRSLWSSPAARDRIIDIARIELENWDGTGTRHPDGRGPREARTRLLARLRSFPVKALDLDLLVPFPCDSVGQTLYLETKSGTSAVEFRSGTAAMLQLKDPSAIDRESMMIDELRLTSASGDASRRRPRRVVPFRFDEMQKSYIEVESAGLGEDCLVMAVQEMESRIDALLAEVARPGWGKADAGLPGLPKSWVLYKNVQILGRPTKSTHVDMAPLLARSETSLSVGGGVALPGLIRKWSSLAPPEVRLVATNTKDVRLEVHRGARVGDVVACGTSDESVVILSLADLNLDDGDYLLVATAESSKRPIATSLLRLRSAATPEIQKGASGLDYSPAAGRLWPLVAARVDCDAKVDGPRILLTELSDARSPMPGAKARKRRKVTAPLKTSTRIGLGLGADSCLRTGRHRIELPTAYGTRNQPQSVNGVCRDCGLVKRYPTTAWRAKKKRPGAESGSIAIDMSLIPTVASQTETLPEAVFDAMCHAGRGSIAGMSRILDKLDSSTLAVDAHLRALDALSHIDIMRDPETLAACEWEVSPPTLCRLGAGRWWLVGDRSRATLKALAESAADVGGSVRRSTDGRIPRVEVLLADDDMELLVDALLPSWPRLSLSVDPAETLAMGLPPLGSIAAALPRRPLPRTDKIEIWDTVGASWLPAQSLHNVGAYRLTGFSRVYALRDDQDIAEGTYTVADARLCKHVANAWAADPLAGYHRLSGLVMVPVGAELPGLYGRSLAMASGRSPFRRPGSRLLCYPCVPEPLADIVHDRLTR